MTTVDEQRPGSADDDANDDVDLAAPESRAAGRFTAVGMPTEKSKDFGAALRRLLTMLHRDRATLLAVIAIAITSAGLNVVGPRVLGHATDVIIRGAFGGRPMEFGELQRCTARLPYCRSARHGCWPVSCNGS
jgi:ATP-binding cassette subfamily B protein